MGNAHIKPHQRLRNNNKKQVHWKATDRPTSPGKPELIPEAEETPDLISLRWSYPLKDGGSPITGFLVEHRRVGSPHWVRATPLPVAYPEITLSGLEPGWRYQFRVSAGNAVGYSLPSEVSEPITVTLQRSAVTAPKFTQDILDTVALENEKCEFVAYFLGQPPPKVSWFKDGFEIFSSRRIRILTEHDRSVLTIHQTSLSDEGEIKCTATNRAGHISSKAKLTVEAPPVVILPRNYEEGLLFELGEIIRLKVSVLGRPTPLVFWSHNTESLECNDRFEIDYTDKSCSLKIVDAQRTDRGEYQIRAVNKLGSATSSFLVTVTDKPSPPGRARVMMTLGRSVTLAWSQPADDGGCKIGNYIVEYYRLGWNVWLKAATSRQLSTRLGDLIEGSEYKFRIKAESPYGVSDPSQESETIFIPDLKRGLTHPPQKKNVEKEPRSLSTPRVGFNLEHTELAEDVRPIRPKRTKSKSQTQTPEASPMLPRKDATFTQFNKNIFDRASFSRDLAYGSPDMKIFKADERKSSIVSESERKLSIGQEEKISFTENVENSNPQRNEEINHTVYKVKIESPSKEAVNKLKEKPKIVQSPEGKKKLIREHSANVSGSSEFMLVLYSEENNADQSDIFNFEDNAVAPPLSLSAPELYYNNETLDFPPLKNSASSTELLHERTMARFIEDAEKEENEREKIKALQNSSRRESVEIPKIRINSEESDDIVGLDRKHSIKRKFSAGNVEKQHQHKWSQKRHSLKNTSELSREFLESNNLKRSRLTPQIKRAVMMSGDQTTSEELTDQEMEKKVPKQFYTQSSFEKKSVTVSEEKNWRDQYEESLSESDADSESSMERFKKEVNKARTLSIDLDSAEENTYRPPGGLSGMKKSFSANEPFEVLNKIRDLPDPNFIPKPILKKTDSPTVSPPSSPIKIPRALSPRPDIILERDRSRSLAVPDLPPLVSSSGEESDEVPKTRRGSLTQFTNTPNFKSTISSAAEASGIAAASIVIPKKLIDKKRDDEASKVVAHHYDDIVRTVGQRRRSNPILDREELKRAAEGLENAQEEEIIISSKEHSPSKESLSQDSGYQSVSGYRRSSFSDHQYDTSPRFSSPMRRSSVESRPVSIERKITEKNNTALSKPIQERRLSEASLSPLKEKPRSSSPRRDSGSGVQLGNFRTLYSQKSTMNQPHQSLRRNSLTGRRSVNRSKSPSKRGTSSSRNALSPARPENWNYSKQPDETRRRKPTPSPVRNSPSPKSTRKPMLKEITTQTSGFIDSFDFSRSTQTDDILSKRAEVKVRSAVDWLTDLAMFAVACWIYIFQDELLAIPILLIMVYRQLKEEIVKRIPHWIKKRLKMKKSNE